MCNVSVARILEVWSKVNPEYVKSKKSGASTFLRNLSTDLLLKGITVEGWERVFFKTFILKSVSFIVKTDREAFVVCMKCGGWQFGTFILWHYESVLVEFSSRWMLLSHFIALSLLEHLVHDLATIGFFEVYYFWGLFEFKIWSSLAESKRHCIDVFC